MTEPIPHDEHCTNCGCHLPAGAKFCPACGQKRYAGPPTLWTLFSEFFESVLNVDNRLFSTLRNLPIPGELTNKYLAGKQRPFFRPLRLFFVITVVMLSSFAVVVVDQAGDDIDADVESARNAAYHAVFEQELRERLDSVAPEFPGASTAALIDTVKARYLSTEPDSIDVDILADEDFGDYDGIKVAEADFYSLTPRELIEKYEIEGWMFQYQVKQMIALSRGGSRAVGGLIGQMVWGILIIIPLAAAMLKLFYIRRKRTYVEHLVFTLHVHAFLFLIQALAALTFYWFESNIIWWL
ncbi:MAG: DUF3667 domain-containing protein, partial [Bacteroidota bacterium]